MNDKNLIEIVRNYPVLYDLSNPKYMDTDFKNNIWNEIGEKINSSGQSCKTRWGNIRDNFRKSLKKQTTVSGQKAKSIKRYKYSEQLGFLKQFFYERETKTNITDMPENGGNNNSESKETQLSTQVNSSVNEPSQHLTLSARPQTDSLQTPTPSKRQKLLLQKPTPPKTAAATFMEYLVKEKESMVAPSNPKPDPVDAFLAGIAPALKKLTPRYWHYAKADIFSAVQKYELRMIMEEEQSAGSPVSSHYSSPTYPGEPSPTGS